MTTLIQETYTPAVSKTCGNCPYYENFGEANGRGWCRAFDQMARQHHQRTGACDTEIEALDSETQQQAAHAPEPQPVTLVGSDPTSYPLQTVEEIETEFSQGLRHGQNDALAGWHPIYKEPATEYARGYLNGYNAVLNPTTQPPEVNFPPSWSISYDSKWHCYRAWLGNRYVGSATTYQEAERKAQKYIATDEIIQRQNAAVIRAYAS